MPTNKWSGYDEFTMFPGTSCVIAQAAAAAAETSAIPARPTRGKLPRRPSRKAKPSIQKNEYSARSCHCHRTSRPRRLASSSRNTAPRGASRTGAHIRRINQSNNGLNRISQVVQRRYQSAAHQVTPQSEPCGSHTGKNQKISRAQSRSPAGSGRRAAYVAITAITSTLNTQSGISSRWKRSRSTFSPPDRSSEPAIKVPATKNIAGMDAMKKEIQAVP